jgi:hypothetical protein
MPARAATGDSVEPSVNTISSTERRIFGLLFPSIILAGGYWLIIRRTAGRGDVGFVGLGLLILMPFVLVISPALSAYFLPVQCRSRVFAFSIGSVTPLVILALEFIMVDAALPAQYRLLQ